MDWLERDDPEPLLFVLAMSVSVLVTLAIPLVLMASAIVGMALALNGIYWLVSTLTAFF